MLEQQLQQQKGSRRTLFSSDTTASSPALPSVASAGSVRSGVCDSAGAAVSAEKIALTLLGHFSQLRMPHEAHMEWLVSEKDAPQHVSPNSCLFPYEYHEKLRTVEYF